MADARNLLPSEIQELKFLVAEKNPALQKSILSALRAAGVGDIKTADSGGEAWNTWKAGKERNVWLCAADLPEMGGLDIVSRLRSDEMISQQPAFILLSGDKSKSAMDKAIDSGVDVFLAKPFEMGGLVPKIVEAVECRKQISGADSFKNLSLEDELLRARLPVEIVFERYSTEVECQILTEQKCVIRVPTNYGLGTQLKLRFANPAVDGQFFNTIKGTVHKTERVPAEFGLFLLHVQFNRKVKERHGVAQLIAAAGTDDPQE